VGSEGAEDASGSGFFANIELFVTTVPGGLEDVSKNECKVVFCFLEGGAMV